MKIILPNGKKTQVSIIRILILLILFSIAFLPFNISQEGEHNLNVVSGNWIKEVKKSGLEKFLFYDIEKYKNGTDFVLKARVNKTIYLFLKDAKENPTLAKCFIIQDYISDDYPNFDCNLASHRTILQNRLNDYINNGWQLFKNGVDRGYIDVTGNNITIVIPNIEDRDIVRLGQYTLVYEYQDINLINYKLDWAEVNVTLFINKSGIWNNTANDVWVRNDPDKDKFGANVSRTEDTFLKYEIVSDNIIKQKSNLVYYISKTKTFMCGSVSCTTEEFHNFDFSDICNLRYNNTIINETTEETDGTVLFNSQCFFNITNNYDENNFFISSNLVVTFYGEYNETLGFISVDPQITISDISSQNAVLTNVTGENNFTHLAIDTTSAPYDNLEFYMSFDTNTSQTLSYDYTGKHDGELIGNMSYNTNGYIGGSMYSSEAKDGNANRIKIGSGSDFSTVCNNGCTFMTWLNITDQPASSSSSIFARYDTTGNNRFFNFYISSTQQLSMSVWETGSGFPACNAFGNVDDIYNNTWVHVTGVYNSGTNSIRTYINGTLNKEVNCTIGAFSSWGDSEATFIGANDDGSTVDGMQGHFDEAMIFNTSLTDQQILDIYNNKSSRFFPIGTQEIQLVNISQSNAENRVNVTIDTNTTTYFDSKLELRLGQVNISDYDDAFTGSIDPDIVLWLHMDNNSDFGENDTHIMDFSVEGNQNNGTPQGDATPNSNGRYFGGFEFDGDNVAGDNIVVSDDDSIDITGDMSISFWFKTLIDFDEATYQDDVFQLLGKGGGSTAFEYSVNTFTQETVTLNLGNGAAESAMQSDNLDWDVNVWYHLTVVWDDTLQTTYHYRNGDGIGSATCANADCGVANANDFNIGSEVNGTLDDFIMWNRTLTASEVKDLYIKGEFNHRYTGWQDINNTDNLRTFNITNSTEPTKYILPEFRFTAGNATTNPFHTPNLVGNIIIDTWGEDEEVVADSCSCPDPAANWELNLNDACSIQSDCSIDGFGITFTGTNSGCGITFNATITFDTIGDLPSNEQGCLGDNAYMNHTG